MKKGTQNISPKWLKWYILLFMLTRIKKKPSPIFMYVYIYLINLFIFILFLKQGHAMESKLSLNLRSSCLSLPNARITGMHHYARL
jgi:hypothetical protein